MAEQDPRSLLELMAGLARDIPRLLEKEVRLARSEAARALALILVAIRRLALGSVVAVGAVGIALAALVNAISALLIARGMEPSLAAAASTTAVTLIASLVAWLLFASAIRALEAARTSLESGMRTLGETAEDVMEKF
jgi:hypothetical protein